MPQPLTWDSGEEERGWNKASVIAELAFGASKRVPFGAAFSAVGALEGLLVGHKGLIGKEERLWGSWPEDHDLRISSKNHLNTS